MAAPETTVETIYPTSRKAWRVWLQKHHATKKSVWVTMYKKDSGMPTLSWDDAVEEALCFGWIDSKRKPVDAEKFIQFFSVRKPNGTWSKINKAKVERLIAEGQMTAAGLACIDAAKQNGNWTLLDEVEELIVPADLEAALHKHAGAKAFYEGLSRSVKRAILLWLVMARQESTRQKRIEEIATLAAEGKKPNVL